MEFEFPFDFRTFFHGLAVTLPILLFAIMAPEAFVKTFVITVGILLFVGLTWFVGIIIRGVRDT